MGHDLGTRREGKMWNAWTIVAILQICTMRCSLTNRARRANHFAPRSPVHPPREKYCASVFRKSVSCLSASRPDARGVTAKSSRNVGRGAVDVSSATDERGLFADGEAVWFWRPYAGVKFARRQRVARMTGSTKQLVPGESAEETVKPLRGGCRMIPVLPL